MIWYVWLKVLEKWELIVLVTEYIFRVIDKWCVMMKT